MLPAASCLLPAPVQACYHRTVWERWLWSYPELPLLELDTGLTGAEDRNPYRVDTLSLLLLPRDERVLYRCLGALAHDDLARAADYAVEESRAGVVLHDVHLLAGALLLAQGRAADAVGPLRECYQVEPEVGTALRRLFPALRLLLRISPALILPLYPNAYGAHLLYAVALWLAGQLGEALEVLREMEEAWGQFDEVRLVAGQVLLARGEPAQAIEALTLHDVACYDAVEVARSLYLAYAHLQRGEYRSGARVLVGALTLVKNLNPHLHARARLLLADLYERNGLPLDALRQSALVEPHEVPGDVAAEMLRRESRWVAELGYLTEAEIDRMARTDTYLMYVPEAKAVTRQFSPLATSRDPLKHLRPRELSWLKRQAEEVQIATVRAAAARGDTVKLPGETILSGSGQELRGRIAAAERWWPQRRQALETAGVRERLARQPAEVSHLRFDFCGTREAPRQLLEGERRSRALKAIVLASCGLAIALWVLRTCVY